MTLEEAKTVLEDLAYELKKDEYRSSFAEKLVIVSDFISGQLDDVIGAMNKGIDEYSELETEIESLNERIEELEREAQ